MKKFVIGLLLLLQIATKHAMQAANSMQELREDMYNAIKTNDTNKALAAFKEIKNLNKKNFAQFIYTKNNDNWTFLHLATYYDNYKVIKKLLNAIKFKMGIKAVVQFLYMQDNNGRTALHLASVKSYLTSATIIDIAESSMKEKEFIAFVSLQDNDGQSALHIASTKSYLTSAAIIAFINLPNYINKSNFKGKILRARMLLFI